LITDVGLPNGINGRQLADAARLLRPDLKVLFITGYAENAVFSHGHLPDGFEVLSKPFTMDDLASRVAEIMTSGSR
jgi:CheY-like chemotaxis protein